ncbi:uncharacterized protein LOC131631164 isoform X2 [Vicia villosa]|uniref:uncharacterized protein LOC131631164 isoform X2 n=1 Tax=Vicia villosa TaxID=3911 RepID=UPI00273BB580|nr:uncharacterized protein LOC131631164 isoform X2 [Vicia villosa]
MVKESQTSRITHIQVRVDCNGCAQKIKKALNDINGIHDLRIDLDRQRLTIIGWADPEKIVKAIKNKTRKNATIICSNVEKSSSKATKPKPKENAPDLDATTQPIPKEAPQARRTILTEPMLEATRPTSPTPTWYNARQQWQIIPETEDVEQVHMTHQHQPTWDSARQQRPNNPRNEDVEQVHMTHHHQPTWLNYVNRFSSCNNYVEQRDRPCDNEPAFQQEPSRFQPVNVTHSYNTYMPSSYVTEYECVRSPSWHTQYNFMEHYIGDYSNNHVDIAAMFSDDNPNACIIV